MNPSAGGSWQGMVSRRGFLKGAVVGGAALTMSARLALAQQVVTGRRITIEDIHGAGVPPGLVRMNLNENPMGPSPRAVQAIADHMFGVNRYGTEQNDLIAALAAFEGITLPKPEAGQMDEMSAFRGPASPYLITAGSSQALGLLTLAYLSRSGGEVIEAKFGYGQIARSGEMYKQLFGVPVNVILAPMTPGYKHDLDGMLKAITPNTTMVVITNPNNPTGTLLSVSEIEAFVKKVPASVLVVVDEAYIHFAEQDPIPTVIPLVPQYENLVAVRTFSKAYAMAGLRLGYAVSSRKVQMEMMKYFNGGSNVLANVAGKAGVEDLDHLQRSREAVWAFKKRCYAEFDKMGLEYIPTQGTFIMVNLKREAMPIVREMRKRNVMISTRRQEDFKDWIRVSAGTMDETEVFLQTLKEVMSAAS
jgi:histidinol-phosphate aminotransferase